jgi:hypothetical protein
MPLLGVSTWLCNMSCLRSLSHEDNLSHSLFHALTSIRCSMFAFALVQHRKPSCKMTSHGVVVDPLPSQSHQAPPPAEHADQLQSGRRPVRPCSVMQTRSAKETSRKRKGVCHFLLSFSFSSFLQSLQSVLVAAEDDDKAKKNARTNPPNPPRGYGFLAAGPPLPHHCPCRVATTRLIFHQHFSCPSPRF